MTTRKFIHFEIRKWHNKYAPEPHPAVSRALGIAEILEQILEYVAMSNLPRFPNNQATKWSSKRRDPMLDIYGNCRKVSRFWKNTIRFSNRINRHLWFQFWEVHSHLHFECQTVLRGNGWSVFDTFSKPLINYPFISWLNWRLSRCFDLSIPEQRKKVTFKHEMEHSPFPLSWFTNPPTREFFMRIKVANSFLPGHKKPARCDSKIISMSTELPIGDKLLTNEKGGVWYTIRVTSPGYITTQDVCSHFSSLMGLGREAHVRDWLKILQVGVTRPVVYPEMFRGTLPVIANTATTSAIMRWERPDQYYCYDIGWGYTLDWAIFEGNA